MLAWLIPESLVERFAGLLSAGANPRGFFRFVLFVEPAFQQLERVVPQSINLDGLAAPRRDHPIVDLGVHPGKCVAFGALLQQSVMRIHADPKRRTAHVPLENVEQLGKRHLQNRAVPAHLGVAIDGVKEPQRRVGGVIQTFRFALRERDWGSGHRERNERRSEESMLPLTYRPEVSVKPSSEIMVSRPQSVNQ